MKMAQILRKEGKNVAELTDLRNKLINLLEENLAVQL